MHEKSVLFVMWNSHYVNSWTRLHACYIYFFFMPRSVLFLLSKTGATKKPSRLLARTSSLLKRFSAVFRVRIVVLCTQSYGSISASGVFSLRPISIASFCLADFQKTPTSNVSFSGKSIVRIRHRDLVLHHCLGQSYCSELFVTFQICTNSYKYIRHDLAPRSLIET